MTSSRWAAPAAKHCVSAAAQRALAALAAIAQRYVEMVAPALQRRGNRVRDSVPSTSSVGSPAASPKPIEEMLQIAERVEALLRRPVRTAGGSDMPLRETGGPRRASRGRQAPSGRQPVPDFASFFCRSSAFREMRLNVPARPIAFLTSRSVSAAISR